MSTAISTPASGITLPKLPPRSSSWRSMPSAAPRGSAAAAAPAKVDITSHVAFPSLGGGGSSAKAPMLVSKPVLDFKKAAAAAPAGPGPDTRITVKPDPIAVTVHKSSYYEDGWPSEDEEDEDEGEYNANLMSDRRRGDKGFW